MTEKRENPIIAFINKIIDKLFSIDQAEKIGKDIIKNLGQAIERKSNQKRIADHNHNKQAGTSINR